MSPHRVDTLEDCKQWIAEHHGRDETRWENQRERDTKTDDLLKSLSLRVSSVEKRMMWISGFAAAAGSAIGSVLSGGVG